LCGSLIPFTRLTPSWLFMGSMSTLIYTSDLILCFSIKEKNSLRVSSVGHFSFLKRFSYSISPRFWPRASREALRWTLSNAGTSLKWYEPES